MNSVFADTSFYVALASPTDQLHSKADALAGRLNATILTTEFIIVELGNFLRKSRQRILFLDIERDMRTDVDCLIVPVSSELLDRGIDLFAQRPDKEWSLTDWISFVVMQDHGVTAALTADKHFEQAGFVPLLAS